MGFKNFRINIIFRALILSALIFAMTWGVTATAWQVTPIACGILAILSLVELIHYVEKSNRTLISFLDFVRHQDFTTTSPNAELGKSFGDLALAYKSISSDMRKLNTQRAINEQQLSSVIEHTNIALLCVDSQGIVNLMNPYAKQIFNTPYLHHLNDLAKLDPKLPPLIQKIGHNEKKTLSAEISEERMQLSIYVTHFRLLDEDYKLISFQNIRDELDHQEIEAWQKLISVLTHEIMNSVTPIISLSDVIKEKLFPIFDHGSPVSEIKEEDIRDLRLSINSIASRSKGLKDFVESYRQVASIPKPKKSLVCINRIIENTKALFFAELEKNNVNMTLALDPKKPMIKADSQQLEQILINLVKNAIEASCSEAHPNIHLHSKITSQNNVLIKISNNGPAIEPKYLDQIFVPFFTTKKHGTGIGLSISQKMATLNKGSLSVTSESDKGSVFTLRFQNHISNTSI